jgi:hypothetical protein
MLRNPSLSLKAGGLGQGLAISCWPRYQGVHGEHEDLFMPALGWLRRGGVEGCFWIHKQLLCDKRTK